MTDAALSACRDALWITAGNSACKSYLLAKDWQTLVAGVLALIGAWATLRAVRKQINYNVEAEKRTIAREAAAATAMLPLVLSDIVTHGNECIREISGMRNTNDVVVRRRGAAHLPEHLDIASDAIATAIRFSAQPHTSRLAGLLAWIQIHEARLDGIRGFDWQSRNSVVEHDALNQMVADSAQLISRAEELFEYGRSYTVEAETFDVQAAQHAMVRNGVAPGMIEGDGDPHKRVVRAARMPGTPIDRIGVARARP